MLFKTGWGFGGEALENNPLFYGLQKFVFTSKTSFWALLCAHARVFKWRHSMLTKANNISLDTLHIAGGYIIYTPGPDQDKVFYSV
jgi:hypothetical protein